MKHEVRNIINFLSRNDIDYCILDRVKKLEYSYATDLDLYVNKGDVENFLSYLKEEKWFLTVSAQFSNMRYFYYKIVNGFKIKLDITTDYCIFYEHKFATYKNKVVKKNFDGCNFLSDKDYFFFTLSKCSKVKFTKIKIEELSEIANKDTQLNSILSRCLNDKNDCKKIVNDHFNMDSKGKYNYLNLIYLYSNRLLPSSSSGNNFTFIGLDGSGKGTYIDLLLKKLEKNNLSVKYVYLGYAQYNIKLLDIVTRQELKSDEKLIKNICRILYLILLPIEFHIKKGRGKYDVIIMDRHPYFERVFPENRWVSFYNKILPTISPNINYLIHLDGDKDVMWGRKKEMPYKDYLSKSKKLSKYLEDFNSKEKLTVDTCLGIEHSFKNIWRFVKNEIK